MQRGVRGWRPGLTPHRCAAAPTATGEVLYAINLVGWGLSTAVMHSANSLRWMGGAQVCVIRGLRRGVTLTAAACAAATDQDDPCVRPGSTPWPHT